MVYSLQHSGRYIHTIPILVYHCIHNTVMWRISFVMYISELVIQHQLSCTHSGHLHGHTLRNVAVKWLYGHPRHENDIFDWLVEKIGWQDMSLCLGRIEFLLHQMYTKFELHVWKQISLMIWMKQYQNVQYLRVGWRWGWGGWGLV